MTAIRKLKAEYPPLRVIKGGKSNPQNILIKNTWNFIHAALWCNEGFTQKQKTQFQKLIAEHYKSDKDSEKIFEEIIEQVCLVKRYLKRKRGRYISKPIDWLNINYSKGLTGTEKWFEKVCLQRTTVPNYNKGISLLAKAIIHYLQEPTTATIVQHRKKLIAEKQFDLLQIFSNSIINFQINN